MTLDPKALEAGMAEEKVSELLAVTDDLVSYIGEYGGRCRDCADEDGVCPMSGLPCDQPRNVKAIRHVLQAINYGVAHGYLPDPRRPTPVTEDVGEDAARRQRFAALNMLRMIDDEIRRVPEKPDPVVKHNLTYYAPPNQRPPSPSPPSIATISPSSRPIRTMEH